MISSHSHLAKNHGLLIIQEHINIVKSTKSTIWLSTCLSLLFAQLRNHAQRSQFYFKIFPKVVSPNQPNQFSKKGTDPIDHKIPNQSSL